MNTISLACIVGNVQEYAERWIKSFIPIADEVAIVRAIGNQAPDETVAIIERECKSASVPFKFAEYKNAPDHDWPHVDNFAAARQLSFDIATGPYCFWCDTDDILQSGAERIRQLARDGGYPVFMFPYRIFGRGITVQRERMILKTAGAWRYPVHECFKFKIEPAPGVHDETVVIAHMPGLEKTGSNGRNLRILESIPPEEMNAGLLYHLQGELAGVGRIADSIEVAKRALSLPDLGTAERYELFTNLGLMSEKPEVRAAYWHQAYISDPTRREALGLLAVHALDCGKNKMSLALSRQMMATLPLWQPHEKPWNIRDDFYAWLGNDIYTQALRCNGMAEQAEAIRLKTLEENGGPSIALVHATRGRCFQASQARRAWLSLAENPGRIEHLFVIDDDDTESEPLKRMNHITIPKGGGCVAAWNAGAFATKAPIIVQMSDDWMPPQRWDSLIMERLGNVTKPKVLAVSDGFRTDRLLCMAIVTRQLLGIDGFLFHPDFTGVYSDNWFTACAYERGLVVEARDLVFKHNHFLATKTEPDKTYQEQNAPERYAQGKAVFDRLASGKDWSSVPGWFNYWPWYDHIARMLKDGDTIAELGTWFGRSSIYMAQRLKALGKKVEIVAVDTFKGEANQPAHTEIVAAHGGSIKSEFLANIERCGVSDYFEVIEGDSAESASKITDGSLAFVFVDAAHDYEGVKRDIAAWRGKVRKDGIISGHDAEWHEVAKAVKEAFKDAQFIGPVWAAKV